MANFNNAKPQLLSHQPDISKNTLLQPLSREQALVRLPLDLSEVCDETLEP